MWFGTDFGEINKFDRQNKTFSHYTLPLDDLDYSGTNEVWKMYEDSVGRFWICTETGGLYRFDRNNESFERFRYKADDPKSISHDSVLSILEDSSGVLWVGTSAGLNRFDPNNKEFFHYRSKHGLPNEVIYGILEENFPSGAGNNYLWMSTNKGLSRFDPAAEIFRNYDKSDGLQSNEFNSGAYLKSQTGEMFFGGINGFNSFFPDRLTDNNQISPIVITDFKVINQSEFINESSEVESRAHRIFPINESIELGYKENIFSISFAVLHFAPPEKNRYAYKMTGIQEDWTSLGNKNSLLFSRVPPGNYVFSVKGSNCDGIWNEKGISLQIKISPPFWKTAWFKIICYCIAGIILITTHQISTKFIRNRNKKLKELNISLNEQIAGREKAEQRITASLKEKNILLKEIHHRVKNNMQIISSLLNVQARGIRNKEAFNILKDSQARIYSLALVHEKLYQSENYSSIEFNNYLQSMSKNLLEVLGHNRNISLDLDVKDIRLGIDLAIPCGLIINELLTNIFKHAFPEGKNGRISITFHSREDGTNQLIVQDNGIGLPKDFNFKNSDTMGMSLVNTLIEQIDAEVKIISEKGTRIEIVFKS